MIICTYLCHSVVEKSLSLDPAYSHCCPQASSTVSKGNSLEMQIPGLHPRPRESLSAFYGDTMCFACTLPLDKNTFRPVVLTVGFTLESLGDF